MLNEAQLAGKAKGIEEEERYNANKNARRAGRASLDNEEYAYHAGDLGKAEPLSAMNGSRDTGHFGTGTYFVGDEKQISDQPHI